MSLWNQTLHGTSLANYQPCCCPQWDFTTVPVSKYIPAFLGGAKDLHSSVQTSSMLWRHLAQPAALVQEVIFFQADRPADLQPERLQHNETFFFLNQL